MLGGYELQHLDVALALSPVDDFDGLIERLMVLRVEFNRPEKRTNG